MNLQNPALYAPQQAYAYGTGMAQPSSYPNDPSQSQFQQPGQFPSTPQRPGQFQQPGHIPPHILQQLQQQQGLLRPSAQGNVLTPGALDHRRANSLSRPDQQPTANGQTPNSALRTNIPQMNNNQGLSMTQVQRPMVNQAAQQMQLQNTIQASKAVTQAPPSPETASREKARVSVLLDINAYLLQEVVSLQSQGKAGAPVQQSPTSPTTENFNSPIDSKAGPSKEYQECMRRLQANLSYLAGVADAKKRPDGKMPSYPAIIIPPPHLTEVHELYRKLAVLFPEASQSTTNKALAYASAQSGNANEQQFSQSNTV